MARESKLILSVTPQAYLSAACMLILIPLPWVISWLVAALVHEVFHCVAVLLSGKRIYSVLIGMNGAQIQTEALTETETLLCALAGPIGGFALILLTPIFPKLSVCALIQTAYNLLPVYPLDGGRALLSFMHTFLQEKTVRNISLIIRATVLLCFLCIGILAATVWKLGFLPLIFAGFFTLRMVRIKIPCK